MICCCEFVVNSDDIVLGVVFSCQNHDLRKMRLSLKVKPECFRHKNKVTQLQLENTL